MSSFNSLYYKYKNTSLEQLNNICNRFRNVSKDELPANYEEAIDIREIYLSNSMEGNTCSLIDTKMIIEDNLTPNNKRVTEILEVVNLNKCLKEYKSLEYVNKAILKDIHRVITNSILDTSGEFRKCSVYISGSNHAPCKWEEVEDRLDEVFLEFNLSKKTLQDIFKLKYKLVYIHPFEDGNGRVSRVVMNALLAYYGYTRLLVHENMRKQYYKSLELASVEGRLEEWLRFCYVGLIYNLYKCDTKCLTSLDVFKHE